MARSYTVRSGYRNLRYADRVKIEEMVKLNKGVKDIASEVGVHVATIYRELKRCVPYTAEEAQKTV